MSLTLTAEPAVIDGARSYAEHSGMTLEALVLAYLKAIAKRERRCDYSCNSDGVHSEKIPLFGALKDKIKFIAPDFDEPLEDFAEYM